MSHDLSSLFSADTPLRAFSTSNIAEVPAFGRVQRDLLSAKVLKKSEIEQNDHLAQSNYQVPILAKK